ncbi:MAG: AMP-binding protein [Gracilimonas sp.]|nr:AMP-binding protein [Gracilimonas sp.]
MTYSELKIPGEPKLLVKKVMESNDSCLIVPSYYRDKNPEISDIGMDRKFVGLFSSGTTGKPKCIWNSYKNLLDNAFYTSSAFEIGPDDKLLMLVSPWHVAGLSWALMAEQFGNEYKFIATKKGDKEHWQEAIQQFKPDVLLTVPAVLRSLMEFEWKVPKIIYGGTPVEPQELKLISNRSEELFQGYGQTEAGGLISSHKFNSLPDVISDEHRCCGQPIKGVEILCEGTKDKPVPILVRSETAYTNEYYKTGDLGYRDDEGNLYINSRMNEPVKDK